MRNFAFVCVLLMATSALSQGRITPGKGGSSVNLQSAFPGTSQAGNINLNGSLVLGMSCTTAGCAGSFIKSPANNLQFLPADFATNLAGPSRPNQYQFFGPQGNNALLNMNWTRGNNSGLLQLAFSGCSIAAPCAITAQANGENTPMYIGGSPFNNASNKVVVTTSGQNVTAGNVFEVTNNGVLEAGIAFNGALTTAVPVPQTSGGTGAGALTCPAGQFVTSNGTAYSCAAPATGSAILSATFTNAAQVTVNGSGCTFGAAVVAPAGTSTTMGCLLNYSGQLSTANCGVNACPTFHCNVFPGTGVNLGQTMYEVRYCNEGTNTENAPAGTYVVHFIPP